MIEVADADRAGAISVALAYFGARIRSDRFPVQQARRDDHRGGEL